jgi:hypothetical protein
VEVVFVVLFLGTALSLSRSADFFVENEVSLAEFAGFDVELSFLILEVELSFLSCILEKRLDADLVEFEALVSLVWFLLDKDKLGLASLVWFLPDKLGLKSLVWFFEERLGLISLVWFLVDRLVVFFFGWSSFSTSNILLLTWKFLL